MCSRIFLFIVFTFPLLGGCGAYIELEKKNRQLEREKERLQLRWDMDRDKYEARVAYYQNLLRGVSSILREELRENSKDIINKLDEIDDKLEEIKEDKAGTIYIEEDSK